MSNPPPDIEKIMAEARAKAAAAVAKRNAQKSTQAGGVPGAPMGGAMSAAAQRLAEMKARLNAKVAGTGPGLPPLRPPAVQSTGFRRDEPEEENKGRGGLDVGIHPALLADMDVSTSKGGKKGKKNAIKPKFATTMANQRDNRGRRGGVISSSEENPYYDASLGKTRVTKQLVFNQKGKYIDQANALRRQAALEAMKKRIAETARKVGIDEDIDVEKAFKKEPPPDIEWWDQGLTTNNTYEDIQKKALKVRTMDSIITVYIQHPIHLEPAQDKNIPPPKPLPLTKREQAKKRRQNRMAELKEKQAKIRLGLEPAPPPKVKRSNMMRVLGDEAVKDPTAVEARVNREVAQRKIEHLQANEARKLTKEEKEAKRQKNSEKDLAKGVHRLVFRIENLASGKHRFKINKFAEQLKLTGICILNPKFNLVVIEGGAWAINKYKKMMLNRTDWTDDSGTVPLENSDGLTPAPAEMTDLSKNKCTLIWEGEVKTQGFRKFTSKPCPTDGMAKENLAKAKMEDFWAQAKAYVKATSDV